MHAVVEKACAPTDSIHYEAGTITPDKVLHAMVAADAFGAYRKTARSDAGQPGA